MKEEGKEKKQRVDQVLDQLLRMASEVDLSPNDEPKREDACLERKTLREQLVFESGVEFERFDENISYKEIDFETLENLPAVKKKEKIATQEEGLSPLVQAGRNVDLTVRNGQRTFVAMTRGKVVLSESTLMIIPSDSDARISILLKSNERAYVDLFPSRGDGKKLDVEMVLQRLKKEGVVKGIRHRMIERGVLGVLQSGTARKKVLAAESEYPRHGKSGRVEYKVDLAGKNRGFVISEDGRVDYKEKNPILEVKKGELLAVIHPPIEGKAGQDIFGQPIPAKEGEEVELRAGENVFFDKKKGIMTAEIQGEVELVDDRFLQVLNLHTVPGDVDLSSGNVSFTGNVLVKGSVRSGFEVQAEGKIMILGDVENCRLRSGLDLEIAGGVRGSVDSDIVLEAGRNFSARFVQNASVEALGNIVISDFSVQSNLAAGGIIEISKGKGAFIGGRARALKGMEVKILGTPAGVKTRVEVGDDFLVLSKLKESANEEKGYGKHLEKIELNLKLLEDFDLSGDHANKEQKKKLDLILQMKAEITRRLRHLSVRTKFLKSSCRDAELPFVRISGLAHADVSLKIHGKWFLVQKEMSAVAFTYSRKDEEILFERYKSL